MFTDEPRAGAQARTDWRDLPVEYLQLSNPVTNALREDGHLTLRNVFEGSWPTSIGSQATEVHEAILQLQQSQSGEQVDWRQYWHLRKKEYYHLAGYLPEFDQLYSACGSLAVNRSTLGNAGAMLEAAGTQSLGELLIGLKQGMEPVRGLGRGKLQDLFARLVALADDCVAGRLPIEALASSVPVSAPSEIAESVRRLSISLLQIGTKGQWLRKAGYNTIGDLADADWDVIRNIPAIGPRTVRVVRERLVHLAASTVDGELDWEKFAQISGQRLLPETTVGSAAAMLEILPAVLQEIGAHLRDDGYRDILTTRLTRRPDDQSTLEEIAQRCSPVVTRERVRQKEAKLLGQLADALLWDGEDHLGVKLHPAFTRWWREAASAFEGVEEIAFTDFVDRLARAWDVPIAALTGHLPFITAVVTGDPQMPAAFRAGARLDAKLLNLDAETSAAPLRYFRLGRSIERLRARGIVTLGELAESAFAGTLGHRALEALVPIVAALEPDGRLNWKKYAEAAGLATLPASGLVDRRAFATSFRSTVTELLRQSRRSDRAARVFELRTCHPPDTRRTLEETAAALGTHASTVKREETVLLEDLYEIIIGGDFSELPIWLDEFWLASCRDAHMAFSNADSEYELFVQALAHQWRLSRSEVKEAAPGLWAIFTGYPDGRRKRLGNEPVDVEPATSIIRLRGFRRLH